MEKTRAHILPIIGCILVQVCVGIVYMWSIFKADVALSFNWTAAGANMVSSYMMMFFVTGNLVGGVLNDNKGPKFTATLGVVIFAVGICSTAFLTSETISFMYLTYSVIAGLGTGIAYAACMSCIQKWLPHRRGLATGLAASAFGFSTIAVSPLAKMLMSAFTVNSIVNFKPVFLILGGVFATIGLLSCIFIKLPDKKYLASLPATTSVGKVVSATRNYKLSESIKTVPFWSIFFIIFFVNGTWNLAVPLIRDLGVQRGLSEAMAVLVVSLSGAANAGGRLIMSALSDKIGRTPAALFISILTFACAVLLTFIGGYPYMIVILATAFGFGGLAAINPAMCTDFFGPKHYGANYGVIMLALGLSSIFFNMISNVFLKGAVVSTFIMGAITAVISVVFVVVADVYMKRLKASQKA